MNPNLSSQRGQALILIALAAIGLFGIAGLAIDGSAKFSDRRHAQNAADSAALAGALAMARSDPQWELEALNRALENGYDDNHLSNEVEVYNPPITGIYADCSDVHFDCNDYVEVLITSHVNTYSNSDSNCAFKKQSCAGVVDVNNADGSQGAITMVGGYTVNTGCMPDAQLDDGGSKQISFPPPYQAIAEPSECSTNGTKTNDATTTTLTPGYWPKIPGNGSTWKNNIVLMPGVYCIGTTLGTNASEVMRVSGTFGVSPGVFLYFKPGGSFTFNGGSGVQLWGINDANVSLDSSLEKYKGFLMYLAPDYASGSPVNCKINGHSGDAFMGTIYAPYCNVTLSGTSDPSGFESQLIGYTVDLTGASNVVLNYIGGNNATWNIPLQVGLTK
jgi:hypothetical protein